MQVLIFVVSVLNDVDSAVIVEFVWNPVKFRSFCGILLIFVEFCGIQLKICWKMWKKCEIIVEFLLIFTGST